MAERFEGLGASFGMMDGVFLLLLLLLIALLLRRFGRPACRKKPAKEEITGYRLIYADQKQGKRGEADFGKLLYSAAYDLQGKPDYVFCSPLRKQIVPVELKSGSIGTESVPHHGDLLQLGAYFLLLEDVYGKRPAYGRIVYRDYLFEIKNTKRIRREILRTMAEMRQMLEDGEGIPKNSFAHCRPCVCNGTVCPFSETEIEGETE